MGSLLTFFSGFGLGTLLTPVFGLLFPIQIAVVCTAIVHFLNNIFKLFLVYKHIDSTIFWRFGLPSVVAAFGGAWLLKSLSMLNVEFDFEVLNGVFSTTLLNIVMGVVIIFFACFDLIPSLEHLTFDKKYMIFGGLLSGFFGGLSGNQGSLRAAFLSKTGLQKHAFVATGTAIACGIDTSRLLVYSQLIHQNTAKIEMLPIVLATCSAFVGAYLGHKLLKKITFNALKYFVGTCLLVFGLCLIFGVL